MCQKNEIIENLENNINDLNDSIDVLKSNVHCFNEFQEKAESMIANSEERIREINERGEQYFKMHESLFFHYNLKLNKWKMEKMHFQSEIEDLNFKIKWIENKRDFQKNLLSIHQSIETEINVDVLRNILVDVENELEFFENDVDNFQKKNYEFVVKILRNKIQMLKMAC